MSVARPPVDGPDAHGTARYLAFSVRDVDLAVPILRVVEIVRYAEPSRLPNAPEVVRGVVGIRGSVVPAVDLGRVLGFGETPITARSCLVLVEAAAKDGPTVVGVIVDRVREVADVPHRSLERPPEFGAPVRAAYLAALYAARGQLVCVLDVDRVLEAAGLERAPAPGSLPLASAAT